MLVLHRFMILCICMLPVFVSAKLDILTFFQKWSEFNSHNRALLFPKNKNWESLNDSCIAVPLIQENTRQLSFSDIRGKLPSEIYDLCNFISNSQDFINAGATPPKGILLEGPSGTGKTLLARALAGELNIPFLSVSASSFIEMYVGVGAKNVRELFSSAKKTLDRTGACHIIIFIDELDAIGSRAEFHVNSETRSTINELLIQMDGFSSDPRIIVIAATNNVENIDDALKRRGRFDYIIRIPLPDEESRLAILNYYLTDARFRRSLDSDVHLSYFARETEGFSGADLEGLAKDAAIQAGRNKRTKICQQDLDKALTVARRTNRESGKRF